MKQPVQFFRWKPFFVMLFLSLLSLVLLGQEEGSRGTDNNTVGTNANIADTTATAWHTSPWVWIIGAAVFILLLIALLSNSGNRRVRVSKTADADHRPPA